MATEKLYPDIHEDLVESKLSKARATEIVNKQRELEGYLKHYKKLRHKWKKAGNTLRIVGITAGCLLATGSGIAGGIGTAGVAVPVIIPAVLAVVGAMEATITESVIFTYIKKKKHRFAEKYDLVNTFLNRLYHLYHRSIEDKVITLEEMEEYHRLMKDYESEFAKLNTGVMDTHFSKLQHQVELEVRDEYKQQMRDKLRDEIKNELKTKFHLN